MERKSIHETYTFEIIGDTFVATPAGDAVSHGHEARGKGLERLRAAITDSDVKHLVVDLSAGGYYGLDMLSEFESLAEVVRNRSGRTALCGLSEGTQQIFERSPFSGRWVVYSTRRQALGDTATVSVSEKSARFVRPAAEVAKRLPGKMAPLAIVGGIALLLVVVGVLVVGLSTLLVEQREDVRDYRRLVDISRQLREGEVPKQSGVSVQSELLMIEKRYAAATSGPELKLRQAAEVCREWLRKPHQVKWNSMAELYLESARQGLGLDE